MSSRQPLPKVEPIRPTLSKLLHRLGWLYEEKYDGWRIVVYKDGYSVRLVSRHGNDHAARFAGIVEAIGKLQPQRLILDGEVCRFDDRLVSRFHLLADDDGTPVATPPIFMAFDALYVGRHDLRALPLAERRRWLEDAVGGAELVFPARRLDADGRRAWEQVLERGYEGLVAKSSTAPYAAGRTQWLKVKVRHEGRFRIGGLTMRDGLAVLVGRRVGRRLLYRGVVEHGLRQESLLALLDGAQGLSRATSPFMDYDGRRDVVWLAPKLVAEVTYAELMQDRLRDPVFRRLVPTQA